MTGKRVKSKAKARASKVGRPRDPTLRGQLLAAALEQMKQAGAQGLSLRELARRVGVSQTAPYRHFADKEALLAALAAQGIRELSMRVTELVEAAGSRPADRLRAAGLGYLQFALDRPVHYRLMFGADSPPTERFPELKDAYEKAYALFSKEVALLLDSNSAARAVVGQELIALMGWSLVHGLASLMIDGRVGDVYPNAGPVEALPRVLAAKLDELMGIAPGRRSS